VEKVLAIKIVLGTFYSGECLLSEGREGCRQRGAGGDEQHRVSKSPRLEATRVRSEKQPASLSPAQNQQCLPASAERKVSHITNQEDLL
jgi:hypothetical protein